VSKSEHYREIKALYAMRSDGKYEFVVAFDVERIDEATADSESHFISEILEAVERHNGVDKVELIDFASIDDVVEVLESDEIGTRELHNDQDRT